MQPETENLILELVREMHRAHCRYVALVQLLIDQKKLDGTEADVFKELEARSEDIGREELNEKWVEERARKLIEAWSKLPKQ